MRPDAGIYTFCLRLQPIGTMCWLDIPGNYVVQYDSLANGRDARIGQPRRGSDSRAATMPEEAAHPTNSLRSNDITTTLTRPMRYTT